MQTGLPGPARPVRASHGLPDCLDSSMSDFSLRVVDVYPFRRTADGARWLVLRRAPDRLYAGAWRMVGGRIEPGEAAWQAALREMREETGREPVALWTLPSVNVFYEWREDRLTLAPAFAAELDADPALNAEHDAFAWLDAEAAAARLAWPEQQRLLRLAADLVARDAFLPELRVPLS